jgi:hypothetical protein
VSDLSAVGYVILFHFTTPYKHARHCFDWAEDIGERIRAHYARETRGPALIRAALDGGSALKVARIWPGTKDQLLVARSGGNASRYCPECRVTRRIEWQERNLETVLQKSIDRAQRKRST